MNNPNEICFFISCDILIMFQHSVYALCISSLYCSFSHIYETFFNVSSFPVEKPHCWQNIDCTSRVNWLRVPKPACNMCKEFRSLSTGSANSNWCISDEHFSWLYDIMIKKKIFLKSWDREIWYKTFNLGITIYSWSQSLHIWKSSELSFWFFTAIFKWKWKQKQCSLLPLINFWKNQC